MVFALMTAVVSLGLFFGMVALLEAGRRFAKRRLAEDEERSRAGLGAVEGAVFGLFGLLVAFTFAGAASRFEGRRLLITEEANAIGTAWLRVDVLPPALQPEVRDLFRAYVDSRLAAYEALPDFDAARAELEASTRVQNQLWAAATRGCAAVPGPQAATLLLPALNELFDVATKRLMAMRNHPPMVILVMLAVLALLASLLAGCAMAGAKLASRIHVIGFASIVSVVFYLIVDLEYPRMGLIRVEEADQLIRDVRESMR